MRIINLGGSLLTMSCKQHLDIKESDFTVGILLGANFNSDLVNKVESISNLLATTPSCQTHDAQRACSKL